MTASQAMLVLHLDAEAVEQSFSERAPLPCDEPPNTCGARRDYDRAVRRDGQTERFEQLVATKIIFRCDVIFR